jgi:hypothetical protein
LRSTEAGNRRIDKVHHRPHRGRKSDTHESSRTVNLLRRNRLPVSLHFRRQAHSLALRTLLSLLQDLLITKQARNHFRQQFLILINFLFILFPSLVQQRPQHVYTCPAKTSAFRALKAGIQHNVALDTLQKAVVTSNRSKSVSASNFRTETDTALYQRRHNS